MAAHKGQNSNITASKFYAHVRGCGDGLNTHLLPRVFAHM